MKVSLERERDLISHLRRDRQSCLIVDATASRADGSILVYRENVAEYLHRRLYRLLIQDDLRRSYLKRTCDTVGCLNPYHYRVAGDLRPGARTACPHGHRYTDANTSPEGHCAECTADRRPSGPRRPVGIAAINAAKEHCPVGHPYDEENTFRYTDTGGHVRRKCRACNRETARRRRANITPNPTGI